MCRVLSSIYFLCICINILTITTRASIQKNGNLKNRERTLKPHKIPDNVPSEYPTKEELRHNLLKKLEKMTDDEIAIQSKIITNKLLNHPLYRSSRKVGIYISTSREVRTNDIIKDIFNSGKECFIPKYGKQNNMTMVRINSMRDFHRLPKNKYNITQPADDDIREDAVEAGGLDMLIVPGVGFTTHGKRLGRGNGCYDRFLSEYDKKVKINSCMTVGLAFIEQLCDNIPTTSLDHLVYFVLYPEQWGSIDF